jgi:hypothetical protein
MNRNQEAIAGSFLKVKNFGIKNTAKLATIAALPPLFTTHGNNVNELFAADAGSRADLRGYTIDKGIKRKALETAALKMSNGISAFATLNNDNALLKRADFTTSAWYLASEEELVTQTTIVRDLSTAIIASLATLGILPADLTALTNALNAFVAVISEPTLVTDIRKEDTGRVADIIDKTRLHLDTKLDVVMRLFESTDLTFYKLYKDARAIDVNGSVMAPTATVTLEEGTIQPIYKLQTFNTDTLLTFQNVSEVDELFVSVSSLDTEEGATTLQIPAGETRQRLLGNLGSKGAFIVAANKGTVPAQIKLWVE